MAGQMTAMRQASRSARRDTGERHESVYRQLRIVAGTLGSRSVAIAYRGGKKFVEAEAGDVPTAISNLKKDIDGIHAQREAKRADGIPTAEEYADALLRVDRFINPMQHAALVRHAARPAAWASFKELARQLDTEVDLIQKGYGRIGRYLADILNYRPQAETVGKALQSIVVIAEPREDDGELTWALRPNFVAALNPAPGEGA
jgi:hypothetical protein